MRLGRRNLHPDQMSLLRGRIYNRSKKTKAQAGSIGGTSKGQNDTCLNDSTAEKVAAKHGVSPSTIKRDGNGHEAQQAKVRQAHGQTAPGKNAGVNIYTSDDDTGKARDKAGAARKKVWQNCRTFFLSTLATKQAKVRQVSTLKQNADRGENIFTTDDTGKARDKAGAAVGRRQVCLARPESVRCLELHVQPLNYGMQPMTELSIVAYRTGWQEAKD